MKNNQIPLSAGKLVAVTTATVELVGSSPRRKSITFSIGLTGNGFAVLGNKPLTAINDSSAVLAVSATGKSVVTLHIATHGEVVRQAWHAWGVAALSLCVLECLDNELPEG